jgi:hypothetical protein
MLMKAISDFVNKQINIAQQFVLVYVYQDNDLRALVSFVGSLNHLNIIIKLYKDHVLKPQWINQNIIITKYTIHYQNTIILKSTKK